MTAFNARAEDLGAELKAARLVAGLTQKGVAARIGRTHGSISKWERGQLCPSEVDTASMLRHYGVTGEDRERLLAMAREAADPNWVVPGLGKRVAATIASEKAARRIVNVEPMLIPGLCQTDDYAHAVMASLGVTRERADQLVATRPRRQQVLTSDDPPEYVAVIGEFALRYPPCDPTVMVEQLRRLLAMGNLPNVSILILPFAECSSSAAVLGSFVLRERRRHGTPVVLQENYRGTTALSNRRDVGDYETAVDEILRKAMSKAGSAAFIGKLLKEMERGS